jgi:hypothetical protein
MRDDQRIVIVGTEDTNRVPDEVNDAVTVCLDRAVGLMDPHGTPGHGARAAQSDQHSRAAGTTKNRHPAAHGKEPSSTLAPPLISIGIPHNSATSDFEGQSGRPSVPFQRFVT